MAILYPSLRRDQNKIGLFMKGFHGLNQTVLIIGIHSSMSRTLHYGQDIEFASIDIDDIILVLITSIYVFQGSLAFSSHRRSSWRRYTSQSTGGCEVMSTHCHRVYPDLISAMSPSCCLVGRIITKERYFMWYVMLKKLCFGSLLI